MVDLIGDASLFPHIFAGWDRKVPEAEKPVITLSANIARIMLLRAGYLESVKNIAYSLGVEAQISWDSAPYISSNHPLVTAVLSAFGLSTEAIYQLFLDATLI